MTEATLKKANELKELIHNLTARKNAIENIVEKGISNQTEIKKHNARSGYEEDYSKICLYDDSEEWKAICLEETSRMALMLISKAEKLIKAKVKEFENLKD